MTAPFAAQLCGYRAANGNPNTSDNNDGLSKELGRNMFDELGVETSQVGGDDPGADMEAAILDHLQPLRTDLTIRRSRSALDFEQYAHLRVFPDFKDGHMSATPHIEKLIKLAEKLPESAAARKIQQELADAADTFAEQDRISERLKLYMPEESLLKMDITCASERKGMEPVLHLGLSSKWTLRTDRAQDCVSQGSKLASQRRGPMPHYAVITMETRSSMLKILADGSGSVDYVYHLALPALIKAMEKAGSKPRRSRNWSPGITFERMLNQGRIRDYDDLVAAVRSLPAGAPVGVPEDAVQESDAETLEVAGSAAASAPPPLF